MKFILSRFYFPTEITIKSLVCTISVLFLVHYICICAYAVFFKVLNGIVLKVLFLRIDFFPDTHNAYMSLLDVKSQLSKVNYRNNCSLQLSQW